MQGKDTKNVHFCKASTILKELKPYVTAQDKKDAMKSLELSDVTIAQYLKGTVRDLTTAEKLIVFFRAAVKRRDEVFANS